MSVSQCKPAATQLCSAALSFGKHAGEELSSRGTGGVKKAHQQRLRHRRAVEQPNIGENNKTTFVHNSY